MYKLLPIAGALLVLFTGRVQGQAPVSPDRLPVVELRVIGAPAGTFRLSEAAIPLPVRLSVPVRSDGALGPGVRLGGSPLVAASAPRRSVFSVKSLLHTLGGAVVGAWIGYFASQVAVSDWETGSGNPPHRVDWALGGAALGAVGGHLVGSRWGSIGGSAAPAMPAARDVITRAEIDASGGRDAYSLVAALRQRWLLGRGPSSLIEDASGVIIIVYMGNTRMGDQQILREIPTGEIERIVHYDARAATLRWGTGHNNGVIQIIPRTEG